MRRELFIILMIVAVVCSTRSLNAQEIVKSTVIEQFNGKDYYMHTVEQGQTLYSISKTYDIEIDELIFANPDAKDGLSLGQSLKIPVISREKLINSELRGADFRFIYHIVKKGETLFSISRIYEVPAAELKESNPGWEQGLSLGQYIRVPLKDPELRVAVNEGISMTDESSIHTVGQGETLYSISRKYKVGIPELKAANPGISNNLSIGQKVNIPVLLDAEDEPQDEVKYYEHIVASKETIYGIARMYRISIDSLINFNPGLTSDIFVGEVIMIPVRKNPKNYITHRVYEKTKLKRIAGKYDLSVSSMKDANPDFSSRLYPGDVVHVPVGPPLAETPDDINVVIVEPDDIPPAIEINDSILCYEKPFQTRKAFKVALMIPLYTEDVSEIRISRNDKALNPADYKPFNFIQFYEGVLMAVDKLKQQGLNVKLYVYDVDENVSKTVQVLQKPELADMDLIIGPFFSRNFKLVSNFAEMFGIKIVNPLTRRNEVLSSDNVFKMKPSIDAQPELLVKFINDYYPESNIILVRNSKFQYNDEIEIIKSSLDKIIPYGVKISNAQLYELIVKYSSENKKYAPGQLKGSIQVENRKIETQHLKNAATDSTFFTNGIAEVIYSSDSIYGIIRNASVARNNLIIVLTDNEIFAPEILSRLNDLKDTFDITVVGMPEWELLENLETDYLLELKVYFFTDSYYNYNDPDLINFIGDFRMRYGTQPNQYAFEGFDLTTYFLGAMMRFGSDCQECLPYYPQKLLKTSVRFAPAYPAGYENLYWNLCRYHDYKIIKVPDL